MNASTLKVAAAMLVAIATLVFAAPYGAADGPQPRSLCSAAKAAALQAWRDSDAADFHRWQVEVKSACLAAQAAGEGVALRD